MKMFEKLKVGTVYKYPADEEMAHARTVYDRFVACLKDRYGDSYGSDRCHSAPTFAAFLLEDVDYRRLDAFEWDKGALVRTKDGRLGQTTGWDIIGFSRPHWGVIVALGSGRTTVEAETITVADVPPEVLEYVKSTLQGKVHDKVDEAFKES